MGRYWTSMSDVMAACEMLREEILELDKTVWPANACRTDMPFPWEEKAEPEPWPKYMQIAHPCPFCGADDVCRIDGRIVWECATAATWNADDETRRTYRQSPTCLGLEQKGGA